MIDDKLARFESQLERLVESAFASFFGRKVRAQDLALQLARAMESHARHSTDADPRPTAPDTFVIRLSPSLFAQTAGRQAELQQTLSQHMVTLAMQAGYRLLQIPVIQFEETPTLERTSFEVTAAFQANGKNSTTHMTQVKIPQQHAEDLTMPAYLLIDSRRVAQLTRSVTNIGRQRDNDVILDDPFVSRHHLQIRRRGQDYILFDVREQSGTIVNGVLVKEHRLQSGDVVQMGKTVMVFMIDQQADEDPLSQTQPLDDGG